MKIKRSSISLIIILLGLATFVVYRLPITKYKFDTLSDLKQYATVYPQNPASDNDDLINTDFSLFYNSMKPSLIKKLALLLNLQKPYIWDADQLRTLLLKKIKERAITPETPLQQPDEFTQKIEIKHMHKNLELNKGASLFIWGDLHGAFHSFIRSLSELEKQGIIDNTLHFRDKNTYFVFLGDAINKSAYSLELLHVLVLLISKNPENVIYLKGNHEDKHFWENFNMYNQIYNMLSNFYYQESDPKNFIGIINSFFSSLPSALEVSYRNEKIFLTHSTVQEEFLINPNVQYIIRGEPRMQDFKENDGLELLVGEYAATQWSLMSCPTYTYQRFFNFHHDSFVKLELEESLSESPLIFYNQDINILEGFKKNYLDPVFGTQLQDKKTIKDKKNIIKLGSSFALTGASGRICKAMQAGLEKSFHRFNNDLSHNNRIKLTLLNDNYEPRISLSNINKLREKYKINQIIAPSGSANLAAFLPLVQEGKVSVFFPHNGATQFRQQENTHLIHFRPSYEDEVKASVEYLVKQCGIRHFAIFYQNDAYGRPMAETAHKELKKYDISKWIDLPHLRTETEFKPIINKLQLTMPEVICCYSTEQPMTMFLNSINSEFFVGKLLCLASPLADETVQQLIKDRGISFILNSVVPQPTTSDLTIAKEYIKTADERFKTNLIAFEGFIFGELLIHAIQKTDAPHTKEKIMKYFESLNNYKFKGLTLTFNPKDRSFSQPVWLKTEHDTWLAYKA